MADINTGKPQSFPHDGATVELTNGGTTYVVLNLAPGVFRFQNAGRERLARSEDISGGVLPLKPRLGDEVEGTFNEEAYVTVGSAAAAELLTLIDAVETDGYATVYTVTVKIPDYKGATTGKKIVMSNASFAAPVSLNQQANHLMTPLDMTFPVKAAITEEAIL